MKCQPRVIDDIGFRHNVCADLLYTNDRFTVSDITALIELRSGLGNASRWTASGRVLRLLCDLWLSKPITRTHRGNSGSPRLRLALSQVWCLQWININQVAKQRLPLGSEENRLSMLH